jgi:hypothetical protein
MQAQSTPPGTPLGQVTCDGYSGVNVSNPRDQVMQDVFVFPPFAPVKVGDGKGSITWTLNPYHNNSWQLWFLDLRWIGSLLNAYVVNGDQAALDHAVAITRSYIAKNPPSGWAANESGEGRAHRAEVLICLALQVGLPQWLTDSLDQHALYMEANYSGYTNHGVDEDLALLDIGCLLGRRSYADYASNRLAGTIPHLIDAQGVPLEQSSNYAAYDYRRFVAAEQKLAKCGEAVPTVLSSRLALTPEFLAQSTMPDGTMPPIGDASYGPQANIPGTPMEFVTSAGQTGTPPAALHHTYTAGYAFGRNTWSPFPTSSWYGVRFGPAQAGHGHADHTSLLYYARGRPILTNGGFYGYVSDPREAWTRSTEANNVLSVVGVTFSPVPTALTLSQFSPLGDLYEMSDAPASGIKRYRSVLVSSNPDVALVLDRMTSTKQRTFRQLWHLPQDETVLIGGRSVAAGVPNDHSSRTYLVQIPLTGQTLPPGSTTYAYGRTSPTLQGWRAPQSYQWVKAPTVEMSRVGSSTAILTLVVPTRYNAKIQITKFVQGSDGYYSMVLVVDGVTTTYRISGGGYLARTS